MNTEDPVSTKMEQIATNARRLPQVSFTSLAYHVDIEWLYEAYKSTDKNKGPGSDGVTAEMYAENLRENLEKLLENYKTGRYKAPPVKRVFIPKGNNEKRPLGITTFEDKILQLANKWILQAVFEEDFYNCSYGFRPNRSQHMAISALREQLMEIKGAWIIDLDIRKYFDTVKWSHLSEFLKLRVRDGVIIRTIGKWMNAGIMEECKSIYYTEDGVQQGGVISPLLSNIYLHEILDKWFHEAVMPRLKGKAFEIRYADDAVLCFQYEEDARRVMEVLPKRLGKFGLELNKEKTKLLNFKRPGKEDDNFKNGKRPGTFDFLGFTHYWAKSRKGNCIINRKTSSKSMTRALCKVKEWCQKERHMEFKKQYEKLCTKIRGHYNYFGVCNNIRSLGKFLNRVVQIWFKWLKRRSNRRDLIWDKFKKALKVFKLPLPYIKHRYTQRNYGLRNRML